jgi:glycosyltransferase involved in cell wall biosynthesis
VTVTVVQDVLLRQGGAERVFASLAAADWVSGALIGLAVAPLPPRASALIRTTTWPPPEGIGILRRLSMAMQAMPKIAGPSLIMHHHVGLLANVEHECSSAYMHTPTRYLFEPHAVPEEVGIFSGFELRSLVAVERTCVERLRHVACNSHYTASRIEAHLGRRPLVIYPPVALWRTPAVRPSEIRALAPPVLVTCCRLVEHKNVAILLEAVRGLDCTLVVVGAGRAQHRFQSLAPENVIFAGELPDTGLRWLLLHCDLYVSTAVEDFGIAVAEAACEGMPCVVPDEGGALEIVDESAVTFEVGGGAPSLRRALDSALGMQTGRCVAGITALRNRLDTGAFGRNLCSLFGLTGQS